MNVLILTPVYPHTNNQLEGLFNKQHAQALQMLGVDVTVVLCKPWIPNWVANSWPRYRRYANLSKQLENNGVPMVFARYLHVPSYRAIRLTVGSCASGILKSIKNHFREKRFDLLQIHSAWPVGLAAPVVSEALKCPLVVTLHIEDDPALLKSAPGMLSYGKMMERASAVVAVGNPLKRFVRENISADLANRIVKIPNGVDLKLIDTMRRKDISRNDPKIQIVSVCNLYPVKGIDLNIQALARLRKEGYSNWHYAVVGGGPEMEKLERLARDLGIAGLVDFMGRLPHREALMKIYEGDIFCLPSRQEAFGIVYLEAMACGKPAVGSLGTGAEDLIKNEKTGLLVPREDVESLAAALKRLMSDIVWAQKLGEAGREYARQFTWESSASKYLELYKNILNSF